MYLKYDFGRTHSMGFTFGKDIFGAIQHSSFRSALFELFKIPLQSFHKPYYNTLSGGLKAEGVDVQSGLFFNTYYSCHGGAVVKRSPPTSEVGGSNLDLMWKSWVVAMVCCLQYRTLTNCMYWFPLPTKLPVVV